MEIHKIGFRWIERFSFILLFLFALFGMTVVTNFIHENSHKTDFKNFSSDGTMCVLEIADPLNVSSVGQFIKNEYNHEAIARYSYFVRKDINRSEFEEVHKGTEPRAYASELWLQILFFACFIFVLVGRFFSKLRDIDLKYKEWEVDFLNKNSESENLNNTQSYN